MSELRLRPQAIADIISMLPAPIKGEVAQHFGRWLTLMTQPGTPFDETAFVNLCEEGTAPKGHADVHHTL